MNGACELEPSPPPDACLQGLSRLPCLGMLPNLRIRKSLPGLKLL